MGKVKNLALNELGDLSMANYSLYLDEKKKVGDLLISCQAALEAIETLTVAINCFCLVMHRPTPDFKHLTAIVKNINEAIAEGSN